MSMNLINHLQAHLNAYLMRLYPAWLDVRVRNIENMAAGWENDLYAFDLSYRQDGISSSRALVLRIYPGDDAREKSNHEYIGMQLLHKVGYPVPIVYTVESQPSAIGRAFLIMERIQGEVMGSELEKSTPQHQAELLTLLCELFVRLHDLDWKPFVIDPAALERGGDTYFTDTWITNARRELEANEKYEFQPVLDWLAQQRDEMRTQKPSLVHLDFHPHNVLMRPDGTAVVIDWSSWRVTDFRFDLAWTLMLADAYAGAAMRRQILAAYEIAAGEPVESIEFFEVCACFRRLLDVTTSLSHGAEVRGMRPEAVELMRSQMAQLERVYELLRANSGIHIPEVEVLLRR